MDIHEEMTEWLIKNVAPKYIKENPFLVSLIREMRIAIHQGLDDTFYDLIAKYRIEEANEYRRASNVNKNFPTSMHDDILTYNLGKGDNRGTDPFDYILTNCLDGRNEAMMNYARQADDRVRYAPELMEDYINLKEEQFIMEFLRSQRGGYNDGWFKPNAFALAEIENDVKAKAEKYFKDKQKIIERYDIYADSVVLSRKQKKDKIKANYLKNKQIYEMSRGR